MADETNQEKTLSPEDLAQPSGGSAPQQTAELSQKALGQAVGGAAVDYFLKIDGIDGESTDDKHKGEIQLESYTRGLS